LFSGGDEATSCPGNRGGPPLEDGPLAGSWAAAAGDEGANAIGDEGLRRHLIQDKNTEREREQTQAQATAQAVAVWEEWKQETVVAQEQTDEAETQ
jgi:hypothetical protein